MKKIFIPLLFIGLSLQAQDTILVNTGGGELIKTGGSTLIHTIHATAPVTPPVTADYYVATTGNDNNPGTEAQPFATMQKSADVAVAGDLIYIRGGVYTAHYSNNICVYISGLNGNSSNWIRFENYPGEVPIIDGSATGAHTWYSFGIDIESSSYLYFKGLHIRNITMYATAYARGLWAYNSSNITCDGLVISQVQGCALILLEIPSGTMTVKNCDIYDNYDPNSASPGGNSDGIEVTHASPGTTTLIKNNRSWYNGDDGFDVWHNEGSVTIDSNWSFRNGRGSGDGAGYKLGVVETTSGSRLLRNNLAFDNKDGFNDNDASNHNIVINLYNNTAYRQSGYGYIIYRDVSNVNLSNNIDYVYGNTHAVVRSGSVITSHTNSWQGGISLSAGDFASLDTAGVTGARTGNTLPVLNFLKLATGSDLINAGTNVGIGYQGVAPDLGVYEKQ